MAVPWCISSHTEYSQFTMISTNVIDTFSSSCPLHSISWWQRKWAL